MLYENEDFDNIFKAAWFVIVTLSTVGYGDISPVTPLGKFLTVPIIVAGLLFMAMPISIVGNNFTVIWEERQVCLAPNPSRAQFQVPTRTPARTPTATPCPNPEPGHTKVLFVVAKIRSLLEASNLTPEHLEQVFQEMDVTGEPQA